MRYKRLEIVRKYMSSYPYSVYIKKQHTPGHLTHLDCLRFCLESGVLLNLCSNLISSFR